MAGGFQAHSAAQWLRRGLADLVRSVASSSPMPTCLGIFALARHSTSMIQQRIMVAARRDIQTIRRWRRTAASNRQPVSTSAGGEKLSCVYRRPSDFLKLAAPSSNARRSSADISGSKLRSTPSRPTTLGSDRVTRNLSL